MGSGRFAYYTVTGLAFVTINKRVIWHRVNSGFFQHDFLYIIDIGGSYYDR